MSEVIWKPRNETSLPPPLGLPRLIWEVLSSRGFQTEDSIQRWLNPSLKILKDPLVLTDMDKAVERLLRARREQEPIVIYADYDLDGTSGLALLLKAFEWMGFQDVTYYQPKRLSEGYGLHAEAVQRLYDSGRRLLVSIDLGITAIEAVELANSIGLDCIITDHHLPKEVLPPALAVINPNRGNCPSNLGHLCGTGVAFYLALALRRAMLEEGLLVQPFDPKSLLDCFVIGTLTDMVPLIEENRVLCKHGLLQLAETKRPGLRVLLQALGLWGKPLTSQDVAIRFAPKLNALSRMETGIQPIDLYLVEDEKQAQGLVDLVLANNQNRQASQKQAEEEARQFVMSRPLGKSIFVYSKTFHRGVVGLVATRLVQEFGVPSFVGSLADEDGVIVGSARMPDGMGLSVLDAMAASHEALEQFGGHAAAAGFELREERAELFRESLERFFSEKIADAGPRVCLFDAGATLEDLNPGFMDWYEHLSPFGAQFSAPVFCLNEVVLQQVKALNGGHFRLTLQEKRSRSLTRVALWFSPSKEHPVLESVRSGPPAGQTFDVLVEPQWNHFNGQKTLQLLIQDIRFSRPT